MKKTLLIIHLLVVSYLSNANSNSSLAIVYYQDSTSSASYKSLLQSYGFNVTLVEQSSVVGYNFSNFNLIIASGNSNNGANYLTWIDDAHANAIKATKLPVLGICQGGGALLYKLGAWNNGGQAAGVSSGTIKLQLLTVPAFNTPLAINIASDSSVSLINTTNCSQATYVGGSNPSRFSLWSILKQDKQYSPINSDSSKYYYFGFDVNTVNDLTTDGKKLFVNLVYQAGNFNFNVVITDLDQTTNLTKTLHFYPNPSNGILNLRNDIDSKRVEITDLQGVVLKGFDNSSSQLDISSLKSGIYLAKIFTAERTILEKIVKD